MISALDIFRIGIGPSSSHTVGPMRIANRFIAHLERSGYLPKVVRVKAYMQGSLAFTGKGHRTAEAILLGLMGFMPETTDPTQAQSALDALATTNLISLKNGPNIEFEPHTDLIADYENVPTLHPNGLRLTALDSLGQLLSDKTYYSTGGGFIASQRQLETPTQNDLVSGWKDSSHAFSSGRHLLELCAHHQSDIASILLENEDAHRPRAQTLTALDTIASAMANCIERGLTEKGILPGGLKVRRRAPDLYERLRASPRVTTNARPCLTGSMSTRWRSMKKTPQVVAL